MSSLYVRDQIKAFCAAQVPTEVYVDLTSQFETVKQVLDSQTPPLTMDDKWMGVQFEADPEEPVALNASNVTGGFREYGSVSFYFVAPASIGTAARDMLQRAETFKNKIRNQRLGTMIVEEVIGPNTGPGASLQFDHGFMNAAVTIGYYYDLTPTP